MQVVARDAAAHRQLLRVADDEGHVQRRVVEPVMVEIAVVVVERLAVIRVDDDDGVIEQVARLQRGEERADGRVHVCDRAVVLGDHIVLVGDARRHPARKEVAERLEVHHRLHRLVGGIGLVAVIKGPLEGRGRQVRRVRIHVAKEEEERLAGLIQPRQLRDRHLVEVLGLGTAALVPTAPAGEVDIGVEPARCRVAAEADAGRVVALLPEDLGQRLDLGPQRAFMPERDDLGRKDVHAGQHGGVGAGGRDERTVGALEENALAGKLVDMGRREAAIPVAAHVVSPQRVDAEEDDVGLAPVAGWHADTLLYKSCSLNYRHIPDSCNSRQIVFACRRNGAAS
ncbi:MAG: hypothetical protein BWY52_02745 [Chloroflexi bacterium ADurb.Bin325]|nr:MAG: hypothetical protein BWY52_02745 [Chloroflexi bacterium ADurb.Bin325]